VQDDAAADATGTFRQLRTDGHIVKQQTIKAGNAYTTVELRVNGPIAFVETTTQDKADIFKEDLNRSLLIRTAGTEEQTRRIIAHMTAGKMPEAEPHVADDESPIIARHREFQEWLERVDVRIPFAARLGELFPATEPQCCRACRQVLAMIEALACLHQWERGKDDAGRVLAKPIDYANARKLLLKPLAESIGLTGDTLEVHDVLRKRYPRSFTGPQVVSLFAPFRSEPTVQKELKKLVGLRILRVLQPHAGRGGTHYGWTGIAPDEVVLPRLATLTGQRKPLA
jgi:hypothetical protein